MDLADLYTQLQEMGLPVDKQTLKNPTEEFMITFIMEYLRKFNFDGNEISKSTIEQLECLSCPDSAADAIKIINLFSALSSICNEIFLQDFSLTDISSPGPKRAQKQMSILNNFLAYYINKLTEKETAFLDLDDRQQAMEELLQKKESTIANIGATLHDRENKLELKLKFQQEIDAIYEKMESNNRHSKQLEDRVKDVMLQHQEAQKKYNDLKAKALKLHKETSELQSKIVKSPEEYAARSKELQNLLEIKKEERQVLTDAISRKKMQIKNNGNAQELVKDLNDKFSTNSNETFKQLKETSEKLEHVQKELDMLKKDICKWSSFEKNNSSNASNDEDFNVPHEHLLLELENQYENKEKEYYSLKNHLKELNSDLCKKKAMLEEEMNTISVNQENNLIISKQCKEYVKHQILEEHQTRQEVLKTLL